jgi:hypothetical protein
MLVIGNSEQDMEKARLQSYTLKKYLEVQHNYSKISVVHNML